jgi:hypothetical protein
MENQNPIVKWPFGAASVEVMNEKSNTEITVVNTLTIVDGVSTSATGNRTLKITADADLEVGARLVVKSKTTAAETLTPGVGMKGEVIEGQAGKTAVAEYVYDGTAFVQTGKSILI